MTVTLKDIAKEAKVSVSAVSQVLRGYSQSRIATDTRQKILEIARDLGYRHNLHARVLRTGKSRLIGVMMSSMRVEISYLKVRAIDRNLHGRGYQSIFRNTENDPELALTFAEEFSCNHVEGVILVQPQAEQITELLASRGIPVVMLEFVEGLPADCVTVDRRWGGYIATKHLLELGHRRIAALQSPNMGETIIRRLEGYHEALQEFGIPTDDELVVADVDASLGDCSVGYRAARELLRRGVGATAVFCTNDLYALGAMKAFGEAGMRIPEDMAVVGFDDVEVANYAPVPLTTVAQPVEELAVGATELLFSRMANPGAKSERTLICLKPSLVVRQSSIGTQDSGRKSLRTPGNLVAPSRLGKVRGTNRRGQNTA